MSHNSKRIQKRPKDKDTEDCAEESRKKSRNLTWEAEGTKLGSSYKRKITNEDDGASNGEQESARKRQRLSRKSKETKDIFEDHDDRDEKEPAKTQRKANKKILRNVDRSYWVLQKEVAIEALQALGEIAHLPSFSSTPLKNVTLARSNNSSSLFMATLGTFSQLCHHPLPLSDSSNVVYGGCGVLAFLDLFWCPLLGCVVSLRTGSILLYKELRHYIHDYHLPHSHASESLVDHIKIAFNINPLIDLPSFFERHRHIKVWYPIPGLHMAEKRYQCPDCGRWYDSYKNHHQTSQRCQQSKDSKYFSIPLYPPSNGVAVASLGTHYRIQLHIPDHRDFSPLTKINKRAERHSRIAEKSTLLAEDLEELSGAELVRSWLDPSFSNGIGRQAPKLQQDKTGFHFVLRGQSFRCLHYNTPPSSDCEVYTGCAVLSFFQLYFSPVLDMVVSPARKTLLCKTALQKVIRSRVHGLNEQTLLDHVNLFSILDDAEKMFSKQHRSVRLNIPILGLEDPKLVFQCEYCGCSFGYSRSLIYFNQHLSTDHPTDAIVPPITTFATQLWVVKGKQRYKAIMNDSWISSQESPPTENPSRIQVLSYSNAQAVYLKGSGLQHHFESWKAKPADLIFLVGIYSNAQAWSAGRTAWKIERCIEQIHRLAGNYLSDAERRLENFPYLRRAVTALHPNPTRFNKLTKDALSWHRCSLTRIFALALRATTLQLGQQFKSKSDKSFCAKLSQQIGSFRPLLSVNQAVAIQNLMQKIIGQSDNLPDDYVLAFMHTFILETFTHAYPVTQDVSSILEQVIIIQCLTDDVYQPWRSASWMYGIISTHFRLAKVASVQAAVLGGINVRYEGLPSTQPISDFTEEVKESDIMNETNVEDATATSFLNEDLDQEPEIDEDEVYGEKGRNVGPFNLVLNDLRLLSQYTDPTNKARLYGRLSSIRESVQIVARTEPLSSRVTWHDNDQEFALSWAFIKERRFNLSNIRMETFIAVEQLNKACQQLFPLKIWESLSSLSIDSFIDDWEATSMFCQIHNKEHLSPMVENLSHHLTQAVDGKSDTLSSIIERSQTFLACFAIALYLTTIPPYASQTVELKYASDGTSDRNFKLMDGKHGVLIWHSGRGGHIGYGKKGSNSAWFIPPQVTLPLILYIGIMRPVEIRLVTAHALQKKTPMDAQYLQTHIFCNPLRRASAKSILWSPEKLEAVLKSGPLRMEAFPHRLVLSAILERKHAELVQIIQQPLVIDAQGQHTPKTSQMCYAVLQLQHTNGFCISGYMKQLLACQALHASCFLEKPITSLANTTKCPTLDIHSAIHRNQVLAFNVARNMVATRYKLAESSQERAAVLSRVAYVNAPFLSRSPLIGCELGGDELAHIIISLARAENIEEDLENGCFFRIGLASIAHLMAAASTLMLAALSEWFSGKLVPYRGDISLFYGKWKEMVASFSNELHDLSEKQLEDWVQYIYNLNSTGHINGANTDIALPLPTSL